MKTLMTTRRKKTVTKPRRDDSTTDVLWKARLFMNTDAAQRQAKAAWFAVDPKLRLEAALQLFRSEEVTLERAAEIAGLNRWVFDEIRIKRGIKIIIEADPAEELDKAIDAIRKHAQ